MQNLYGLGLNWALARCSRLDSDPQDEAVSQKIKKESLFPVLEGLP